MTSDWITGKNETPSDASSEPSFPVNKDHLAKQNESLVSAILSTTKTMIFWKDADRRFLGVNQAFLDYYGFKDQSVLLGKTDEEMGWHPNPGPYQDDEERVIKEGISTYRVQGQCVARGEVRDIVASKAPLIVDGKIVGLVGSFDDITLELKQSKEISTLNNSLQKRISDHDQLMNLSDVCIVTIALPDYTIVEYNDAMCEMVGLNREDYEKRYHGQMSLLFSGAYRKSFLLFQKALQKAHKNGQRTFPFTLRVPSSHGAIWVSGACSFAAGEAKKEPTSVIAIFRDISDIVLSKNKLRKAEKEAEKVAQIEEQNTWMSRMINSVPSGLGALRIEGGVPNQYLQLNRYFFDRVDLVGNGESGQVETTLFPACLHPDDRQRFREGFARLLKSKGFLLGDFRIRLKKDASYSRANVRASISRLSPKEEIAYFVFTDIAEAKKAEADLRDSRYFYKEAVRAAKLTTWTYNLQTHEIIMSDDPRDNPFQWTNSKVIENVPASILNQIEEADRPAVIALYQQVDAGHDGSCEFWFRQQNAREPRCERMTYIIQKDEAGTPIQAIGLGQNITAEKKVEEHYERELGFLRDTNDNNLIAKGHFNLTKDQVLEYTTKNDSFFKIRSGTSYSEAVKAFISLPYQKEERNLIADKLNRLNLLKRYQNGQTTDSLTYRRRVKGELPVWISMNIHTYTMPETGDIELFSYAYDVSDKREIDELMSLISEADFDYVGYIFPETKTFEFIKKNSKISFPELRVITPYEECCDYVRRNFVSQEERDQFDSATSLANILQGLSQQKHYVTTYRRNNGGAISCKQMSYVWLDEAAQIILVVRSDVTAAYERDQAQLAAIESARAEAEKANEAKSAFLSTMSHDIRTPLNGVIGFTELAMKENDPEAKRRDLEMVDSSAKLMLDLVNDVLELSRIESGKSVANPEATTPEALIPAVVTALRPSAESKAITLDADFTHYPTAVIWCDKLKIQRIALNLLSNAIKYTLPGGKVSLRFEEGTIGGKLKRLIFRVEDTGIGMSEEFMKRMYEPFSQERRSEAANVSGTGLGLAIVKRFVELLGGVIEVDSVVHQGTRFRVSLPISEVAEGQSQKAEKALDLASLKGKRLLLCEDNALNSEIATMILKEKGIRVELAEDGRLGLRSFQAKPAHYYDGILMDLRMPHLDGIEASKAIRSLDREDAKKIPIIAMTADVFEESIKAAQEAGMDAYITKPIIPEKLFETLALVLKDY